ncbi:MAG: TrkA family potassium uptake protein [Candidatus Nanohaloarchaea archaeon]
MYVVIAGINTLSRRLVNRLEERHDVVIIDADEDRCKRLYSSSGATVINKSPATLSALEDAGITEADVLISTSKDDNENMVICSLGKKYGVPKVVARVEDDEYYDAFQVIGAETIGHTDILISEFLSAVEHPYLVKLANLENDREVLKASINEDSDLIGSTVKELQQDEEFPDRFKVSAVVQPDKVLTGDMNIRIDEDDQLVLIGPEESKPQLDNFFQKQ